MEDKLGPLPSYSWQGKWEARSILNEGWAMEGGRWSFHKTIEWLLASGLQDFTSRWEQFTRRPFGLLGSGYYKPGYTHGGMWRKSSAC